MDTGKFSKAKVYKITDVNYTKCYIGSTCEELSQRMARHRYKFNQHINHGKESYRTANALFHEFGVENCKIELIEAFPCNNAMELHRREGQHIKAHICVNKNVAGRTQQEYYQDNKEQIERYRDSRKEITKEYHKNYRENNRECIAIKKKEHAELNKEKLKAKRSEQHLCECGIYYTTYHKNRHQRTKTHQQLMQTKLKQQEPEEEAEPVEQSN